ncbi:MAG: glycosyltransferase family 4 protein, partial [bacterium]
FIQREIFALKQAGLAVEVIADAPDDFEVLDPEVEALFQETHYLFPVRKIELLKYFVSFFLKEPFSVVGIFLYVRSQIYTNQKSFKEDILIFAKALYLAGVLKGKRFNHAHAPWSDVNAFVLLLAARLAKLPYSIQVRAHDVHRKSSSFALAEKLGNARFIVSNCRYNEAHLKSFLNQQTGRKIYTIYNGLNLERFVPRERNGELANPIRILAVGRLIEQKGLVYLLRACKTLLANGLAIRCEIIGGPEEPLYGKYHHQLKELLAQLGLKERVFFAGALPFSKVLEAYRNADIFVLPCVLAKDGSRDITPNSVLEAMAMKLPVISTPITGIPEIVDDGINGILVPPGDEHALAAAIMQRAADPELRKKLGENARKKIAARFDSAKNIKQYIDLFNGDYSITPEKLS